MLVEAKGSVMAKKGRPKKPGGEGAVVRIHSDLKSMADYLAALRGIPTSDYLSELLRPMITREMKKAGKDLLGEEADG